MLSGIMKRLRETFCSPPTLIRILAAGTIVIGLLGTAWIAHAAGGAKFATLHLMYLPIILAALVFGVGGGIAGGVAGGLLLGPYMLLDTATGEAQQLANWLIRMAFFCMVGGVVGIGAGALRRQLRMLDWLNDHDAQTGLFNQAGFVKSQRRAIERARVQSKTLLVVAQIKSLLDIQDTFGALFSEKLLKQICERGRGLLPADVPLALIQPDCLAFALHNKSDPIQMRRAFEMQMRSPYRIDDVPVHVDFAFGAADRPQHARTIEELLQKASIAAHTAVLRHLPHYTYDSTAEVTSRDNLQLLAMIPAAIDNNEFLIWHQAKLSLATGKVSGTEALLRWNHPQRGFIPPGAFIPQAEDSTLIDDITKWVIGNALADKATWTERGHSLGVAINLSVRNLHQRSLLHTLEEAVSRYRIDPHEVELEITESAVMGDIDYCVALIKRLRDSGYRVSIDDFGTGHSSLAYLKKLPVNALKLDQAFIRNLGQDETDRKIVRTVLKLARSLSLESVAEGVEDEKTLTLLRDWGCSYAQGFAVHKPSSCDQLLVWLESNGGPHGPAR